MTEHKLFEGDTPYVSTFAFHEHIERAPHLEQGVHSERIYEARDFTLEAARLVQESTGRKARVSDLGCGDGGPLSLVKDSTDAWGYDFLPANSLGWAERRVTAQAYDVFGEDRDKIVFGDITVITEVLEHLANPHEVVRWIGENTKYIVASSPWWETPEQHCEEHAWAWDVEGYASLIEQGGFRILKHTQFPFMFQVVLGVRD